MKIRQALVAVVAMLALGWAAGVARGHFQVLIPSADVVEAGDDKTIRIDLEFTHPMEQGPVMEMGPPRAVRRTGGRRETRPAAGPPATKNRKAKRPTPARCEPTRPAIMCSSSSRRPTGSPPSEKMIVHYTKVVVGVMGAESGWDAMVGLARRDRAAGAALRPVDRQQLSRHRPAERQAGARSPRSKSNTTTRASGVRMPNDAFVTQVVKADAQGVFCYTMPRAGWWGFAALVQRREDEGPRRQAGGRGARRADVGQDGGHAGEEAVRGEGRVVGGEWPVQ